MGVNEFIKDIRVGKHSPKFGGLEILKFIGPGLLVTIGFIDPGNWASNLAAGAKYGYILLWMVTLSTIMLIILQHNVAHLGIATGLCLSEATIIYVKKKYSILILGSAMIASISTSLAEILGGAIALNMLFEVPIRIGAVLVMIFVFILLYTNTYKLIERWIIAFVAIIGLSFIYELTLVDIEWGSALVGWVKPSIPQGSLPIIMSVLGAVVMPHNLFLHSEIIQSRQWNLEDEKIKKRQLSYEFLDTISSMIVGWAINSAIIILAVTTFFKAGIGVTELPQAKNLLEPLVGNSAAIIFAISLLFSGLASTTTSGMAAGSIFSGFYKEPYNIKDNHSRIGVAISLLFSCAIIFFITNPFNGLIFSQMILSIQLPITIFLQIYLTSSEKVMGIYKNKKSTLIVLYAIGAIVTILNVMLFMSFFGVNI
jgi:manganese transport protein